MLQESFMIRGSGDIHGKFEIGNINTHDRKHKQIKTIFIFPYKQIILTINNVHPIAHLHKSCVSPTYFLR